MNDFLIDPLKNLESYNKLLSDIKNKITPISTYGIIDENLGHFSYAIKQHTEKPILLITYDDVRSRIIYDDIKNLGYGNVALFPKREVLYYDVDAFSSERTVQRINVLSSLMNEENMLVISSISALLDKVPTPEIFKQYTQSFEIGKDIDLDRVISTFISAGYERVPMVEGVGQFSLRGGIIDFYPPNSNNPYRVELFDTEVDSIRTFDLLTQRSIDNENTVTIPPVKETLIIDEYKKNIIKNLEKDIKKVNTKKSTEQAIKISNEKFSKYIELLNENMYMANRDLVIPYIPEEYLSNLISYFSDDLVVIIDEPKRVEESYKNLKEDFNIKYTDLFEIGEVLPGHLNIYTEYKDLIAVIKEKQCIINSSLIKGDSNFNPLSIVNFTSKSMPSYHSKMELLKEDLVHYRYRGYKIIILSGTEERGMRLQSNLRDMGIETSFFTDRSTDIKSSQIFITPGSIKGGFEYLGIKLVIISDKEIFGAGKKRATKKHKKKKGKTLSITDLNVGDYVVHETYGIGQYEGIVQLNIQGVKKDFLGIQYKGKDKLYLQIDQMNLIQKYIGSESKPKINKLSSSEWTKTKAKAKKAVEVMAMDLVELYAKREKLKGYAFGADTPWQRQFEDLFPYEETDGQLRSVEEIKMDMEGSKPMDRLLCGDVGYGKTEVALRAAFKALMEGKQVAILVPTTILAQQHYNTIMDRFANFPIKVALLSRFRSAQEQKISIEGIRKGTVDMVVGTHRLLSKDVVFKDLGLLIIDEEQRFGVKHKETLKKLKETVDVLTLTATPIPRTLHMSLVGIRDMSVIEDPPEERYPIQTYVVEFNEQMIRDAILREIGRGGQVYFVYNRVETIDQMVSRLRALVPEATFSVGHGQMAERQLEKVMMDFLNKEQDVLVCTTIIETGLDIPNVNTIIIYDADKMGLSQLYQLRGRVGRSNRVAYGYFTYEKDKVLTEVAEKRLRAIKEFTEFGSGYKIAMRDLEIRGAGNLVGHAQHGHMDTIGYDLYVKYLSQAINRLKGNEVVEELETTIDLKVDGFIPKRYIADEEQKIEIYKKISSIENMDDYRELLDELIDRFGDIPEEVSNLMDISYIRALSSRIDIKNIQERAKDIKIDFASTKKLSLELIHYLSEEYGKKLLFDLSNSPYFLFKVKYVLEDLKALVEKINAFLTSQNTI
ncbi:transcription-repair coupling factor [Tissierella sp. Yu-01]|uniref:transcription-repair coupling factor n=1 Tax=Tissierella sp. Yu-01 TaxID=3035694 RepID=UPI00240E1BCB|nr:transcription-repair coupling factor [Tissierella sp. Yu-01]WFA07742.1 transcription-repair coupling factor [Tissierella sp. Yu-01]